MVKLQNVISKKLKMIFRKNFPLKSSKQIKFHNALIFFFFLRAGSLREGRQRSVA